MANKKYNSFEELGKAMGSDKKRISKPKKTKGYFKEIRPNVQQYQPSISERFDSLVSLIKDTETRLKKVKRSRYYSAWLDGQYRNQKEWIIHYNKVLWDYNTELKELCPEGEQQTRNYFKYQASAEKARKTRLRNKKRKLILQHLSKSSDGVIYSRQHFWDYKSEMYVEITADKLKDDKFIDEKLKGHYFDSSDYVWYSEAEKDAYIKERELEKAEEKAYRERQEAQKIADEKRQKEFSANYKKGVEILLSFGLPRDLVSKIMSLGFHYTSKEEALKDFKAWRRYTTLEQRRSIITASLQANSNEFVDNIREDVKKFTMKLFGDLTEKEIIDRTREYFEIPRWFDIKTVVSHKRRLPKSEIRTNVRSYAKVIYVGLDVETQP